MALEIQRKERETTQSLLSRFKKAVQQSGLLREVRKKRFKGRDKSNLAKKKAALRREQLKKEYEKIKKLSKPKE